MWMFLSILAISVNIYIITIQSNTEQILKATKCHQKNMIWPVIYHKLIDFRNYLNIKYYEVDKIASIIEHHMGIIVLFKYPFQSFKLPSLLYNSDGESLFIMKYGTKITAVNN